MALITDDNVMRSILTDSKVVAVVGHSDKTYRTSYRIAQFLRRTGYKVYAVNPTVDEIDGEQCYPNLKAIPEHIDLVDVFRRAEHLPGIIQEAADVGADAVWGQLSVASDEAAQLADDLAIPLVMDRCIKVEYWRLLKD